MESALSEHNLEGLESHALEWFTPTRAHPAAQRLATAGYDRRASPGAGQNRPCAAAHDRLPAPAGNGDHDDRRTPGLGANASTGFISVDDRQTDVHQDDVGSRTRKYATRSARRACSKPKGLMRLQMRCWSASQSDLMLQLQSTLVSKGRPNRSTRRQAALLTQRRLLRAGARPAASDRGEAPRLTSRNTGRHALNGYVDCDRTVICEAQNLEKHRGFRRRTE